MKKVIGIVIFILLLFVIIFYKDLKAQYILRKEVNIIYKLDWNKEEINMNIKSSGESAKVEKIIKEYYNELYNYRKEYDSIELYQTCTDVFSLNNLKNGDLNKSKTIVSELYNQRNNVSTKITKVIDNDYILSLIENKEIKKYYIWLYKRYTISNDIELIKGWNIEKEKDKIVHDLTIEALDVLINNKDIWHVENNKLYFNDATILKQYNDLVYQLNNRGNLEIKES